MEATGQKKSFTRKIMICSIDASNMNNVLSFYKTKVYKFNDEVFLVHLAGKKEGTKEGEEAVQELNKAAAMLVDESKNLCCTTAYLYNGRKIKDILCGGDFVSMFQLKLHGNARLQSIQSN